MKTSIKFLLLFPLLGFCLTFTAHPADIRQGLVAYWPLDVNNGGTTPDFASFNPLTVVGAPAVGAGTVSNAFSFDGGTTYLTNIHSSDNTATGLPIYRAGSYTIAMWVKGAAQTAKYLFSEGNTNTGGTAAGQTPLLILQTGQAGANNAKFDVIIRNDGNVPLVNHVASTNVVFDNNWHHIAWVDDRGSVKLYVDGVLDPANFSYIPSGTFTFNVTAIGTLVRATVATGNIFLGQMDDVAVWERALSQEEVEQVKTFSLITAPPFITKQPVGATRLLGDRITFASRAGGTSPLSYQWFKNETLIPGATSSSLSLSNLTVADSGGFTVQATNFDGSVTSLVATLTVLADPAPDVRQGLISYWPLNEIIGSGPLSTPDLYSHNDMTLVTSNIFDLTPGAFGDAILFNGIDQYGFRSSGFPIYNNPSYSIALWVKAGGTGQTNRIFFSESSTNNANPLLAFGTDGGGANGAIRVFIRNDPGTTLLARNSTRTPLDGTWHHVVWTDTNGQAKLYVDGILDDSDFTYTRSALALNQTAIAAILRATVGNYLAGALDELAVWTRVLTFTEIQQIRTNGIPPPLAPIPPTITLQPVGQSLYTGSKVTFSFAATGTSPLAQQWRKNGAGLAGETNLTLMLTNVAVSDSGDYTVVVTNSAGSATSEVATLTVTVRPPPPTELAVDFNNNGLDDSPANTEAGFSSFSIPITFGTGPFTHSFGGSDVTLLAVGTTMESRKRATPVNNGAFTEEKLLQDFVFTRDATIDQGLDVAVEFLETNVSYRVSVWSFDSGSSAGSRVSNWMANGLPVRTDYTFIGSSLPTDNNINRIDFDTTSDANGKILIQGRRSATATVTLNVFINALKISKRYLRVSKIELPTSFDITLTIELLNPAAAHHIEEKTHLEDATWTEVPNVFIEGPTGNILKATFPAPFVTPDAGTHFYRVVQDP